MSSQGKLVIFFLERSKPFFLALDDARNAVDAICTSPNRCLSKRPSTARVFCSECRLKWQRYLTNFSQLVSASNPFSSANRPSKSFIYYFSLSKILSPLDAATDQSVTTGEPTPSYTMVPEGKALVFIVYFYVIIFLHSTY